MNLLRFIAPLTFFVLAVSCGEGERKSETDTLSPDYLKLDPYKNLDPDSVEHVDTGIRNREKWYGMSSDDDTIIYELNGEILLSGVVTGKFHHMERGDFMHFVLEDSNGYLHSFFMNTDNQRQMDKYYEGYEPSRGHPVTVKWIRGRLPISESGAMLTVYQAKEIIE